MQHLSHERPNRVSKDLGPIFTQRRIREQPKDFCYFQGFHSHDADTRCHCNRNFFHIDQQGGTFLYHSGHPPTKTGRACTCATVNSRRTTTNRAAPGMLCVQLFYSTLLQQTVHGPHTWLRCWVDWPSRERQSEACYTVYGQYMFIFSPESYTLCFENPRMLHTLD